MLKEYLGNDYSNNHLRNFCLYWMGEEGSGDEWRSKNDPDCLYFNGDLRADTLMSAWTPIKWVADCLNSEYGIKFRKIYKLRQIGLSRRILVYDKSIIRLLRQPIGKNA